jgi:ketosteroid isomerase-like protein
MTWYEEFYAAVDAMDAGAVTRQCTPDTTLRFANHPSAQGREQVRAALEQVWSTLGGLHHTITTVTEQGARAVVEAMVDYTRLDGSVVSIPAATAIERRDGLVAGQWVYVDVTPLAGRTA